MTYDAILAESTTIHGAGGDEVEAYVARPLGPGPYGGVVVIHHFPGYDAGTKEIARTFAVHGYAAVVPNLYWRESPGVEPSEASAAARAAGGVPDERLVGDVAGAAAFLRSRTYSNGKVGVIGYCSGGSQSVLAACSLELDLDAAVNCYGAFVTRPPQEGSPMRARPLLDLLPQLSCPLLGLFGQEDQNPSPEQVDELEVALKDAGKAYEFHRYEGAGHGFFSTDRPGYRVEAATDGWQQIFAHFGRHLSG